MSQQKIPKQIVETRVYTPLSKRKVGLYMSVMFVGVVGMSAIAASIGSILKTPTQYVPATSVNYEQKDVTNDGSLESIIYIEKKPYTLIQDKNTGAYELQFLPNVKEYSSNTQ